VRSSADQKHMRASDGVLGVRTFQMDAGYSFNSAGGAYLDGIARLFEDKIRVAEVYLEMREINPDTSIRALSRAANVSQKFATKVIGEIESGALIVLVCRKDIAPVGLDL